MATYRVAVVNENKQPITGVVVEAVSLNNWPDVTATAETGRNGTVQFTGISGPHWFRPRVRRTSTTIGGRVYTGAVEVQVVNSAGEKVCVDLVVDCEGMGTHTTLAAAVAQAIADQANRVIFLCCSVTESDIEIGGLSGSQSITIISHSNRRATITTNSGEDMFKQTSNGGNQANGGLFFKDVGLKVTSAGYAVFLCDTSAEITNLSAARVKFDGGYFVRNLTNLDAMGNLRIHLVECIGDLKGFYQNEGSTPPDQLYALNNKMTLTHWWKELAAGAEGAAANAADSSNVIGGRYAVTEFMTISAHGNFASWSFQDFTLITGCSGAHFRHSATDTNHRGVHYSNILFLAGANDTDFGDFQGPAASQQDNLYIVGIHGAAQSGVTPSGTFLTVDSDITNPYVADIWAPAWPTVYSGPTITPAVPPVIDHGDLDNVTSDQHHALSHDVLSADHPDTLAASVVRGDVLVANDTPVLARLPIGAADRYLKSDGTDAAWGQVGHDELTLIGSATHAQIDSHLDAYNGSILEPITFVVTSNGTTITGTLDADPTGDMTQRFSDGYSTLSSGATVTLTGGTATAPKKRLVYILQSAKTTLVEADQWPAAEHCRIAEVVVRTAALVQNEGVLANRNWNNMAKGTDGQGHHLHAWERLRWEHSAYFSGSAATWSGSGTAALNLAITAGKAYQMHLQSVAAFDTTTPASVLVPNHPTAAYTATADIETLILDSDNNSLANRYYNLVLWCSVSSGSEQERIFINLPGGSYLSESAAIRDTDGFDNFAIPEDFRGYAYLIQRVTIKHSPAGGGTWTIDNANIVDLRGTVPSIVAGGGTSVNQVEFADSQFRLFDDGDPTKELAFQLSGISVSTTRVITMPDGDGTLLLAEGLPGGQTLIGDTADGGDLTLGSTVHGNKGSIFLGSASEFELDEVTGQLKIPTQGAGAGLVIGEDVHFYRAAADLLALAAGDSLDLVQGYIQLEDMATPAAPDVGEMKFFVRVAGSSIELIGQGVTGEECIICSVANVAAPANVLTLNWIE